MSASRPRASFRSNAASGRDGERRGSLTRANVKSRAMRAKGAGLARGRVDRSCKTDEGPKVLGSIPRPDFRASRVAPARTCGP